MQEYEAKDKAAQTDAGGYERIKNVEIRKEMEKSFLHNMDLKNQIVSGVLV